MKDYSSGFYVYLRSLGSFSLFIWSVLRLIFKRPLYIKNFKAQFVKIGYESLFIIIMSSFSIGMILILQLGESMRTGIIGNVELLGYVVSISIIKEFGPLLTALMITGRIGSSIATEIGSMKISEQFYALISLAVNPIQYLVIPRLLVMLIILPVFTLISYFFSIFSAMIAANLFYDQSFGIFIASVQSGIYFKDTIFGIIKSFFYGFEIVVISTYHGFQVEGGAVNVGRATTNSVVQSNILVTVTDYLLNYIIVRFF